MLKVKERTEMSFIVYSKPGCGFCDKAKDLLASKNIAYTELILDVGQVKEESKMYVPVEELFKKVPNARTVPQIFNGDTYIGGYDALRAIVA